jgi:hypothetical protein
VPLPSPASRFSTAPLGTTHLTHKVPTAGNFYTAPPTLSPGITSKFVGVSRAQVHPPNRGELPAVSAPGGSPRVVMRSPVLRASMRETARARPHSPALM